ncbi:hypothetical protein ACN9ML_01725 [Dyadobacter endophyticus]|uniref:hypothetical protein n=1 Tax=Dyadobacter TaxID=120831 RepID=UPI003CF0AC11
MINSALPKDASYPSLCSDILPRATLPTMVIDPTTYITHRVDFSQVNTEHFSLQRTNYIQGRLPAGCGGYGLVPIKGLKSPGGCIKKPHS